MKNMLFAAAAIASAAGLAPAHAEGGEGLPIIVMAEDSDPNSVTRSSDIHRRVMTEIQRQFADDDWYVIDESAIAAKLDWSMRDRRPKEELIQIVDLACKAEDATLCGRALIVFKIRAAAKDYGFGTKAQVRLAGDIYDVASNQYLGGWEPMRMEFPAPRKCAGVCIEEVVGDHARDIAASLGVVLSEKLAYIDRGDATADYASPDSDPGLINNYNFTFRNFTMKEILAVTEVMEAEFPDYVTVRGVSGDATVYKYNYASRAKSDDIYKWMNILFTDMGYEPHEYRVTVRENRLFTVERMVKDRRQRAQREGRFE